MRFTPSSKVPVFEGAPRLSACLPVPKILGMSKWEDIVSHGLVRFGACHLEKYDRSEPKMAQVQGSDLNNAFRVNFAQRILSAILRCAFFSILKLSAKCRLDMFAAGFLTQNA